MSIMSIMSIQVFESSTGHFALFDSRRVTVAVRIAIARLAWSLGVRMTFWARIETADHLILHWLSKECSRSQFVVVVSF